MSNIVDFIFSHIPWMFTTIIIIALGITGLKVERLNNFNHEAEQVIARYGGITPQVVEILNRDSSNNINNTVKNQAGDDFESHEYISNKNFTISTLKRDANGRVVMGNNTSDFNGNGDKANVRLLVSPSYAEAKNGHYVKIDGYYQFASLKDLNGKYKNKTRYKFGYYEKSNNGEYVYINGVYIKKDDPKLTAEQKKGTTYKWTDLYNKTGVNFVEDSKGHYVYIHEPETGFDDYVWASSSQLNNEFAGKTRYSFKGNYELDKHGRYKNDPDSDHFISTVYQTDDMGRTLYDDTGQPVVNQQIPNQTTNFGGKITYVIWIKFNFFHITSVEIPTVHTVKSQVRQGSVV